MTQAMIEINDSENTVIGIVKAVYGLRNRSEAINLIINKYYEELLEFEVRPEYIKKLEKLEKIGYGKTYHSVDELRAEHKCLAHIK